LNLGNQLQFKTKHSEILQLQGKPMEVCGNSAKQYRESESALTYLMCNPKVETEHSNMQVTNYISFIGYLVLNKMRVWLLIVN
jgi:hypothetical protein